MQKSGYKMQNVKFKSVDDFLDYLPEDELKITLILRELILECLPNCKEKLSYNVPFYKINKGICFIWPSSILWGKNKTYRGVRLGFNLGHLLTDSDHYLDQGNRKYVSYKDFEAIDSSDISIIKQFLFESVLIDSKIGDY